MRVSSQNGMPITTSRQVEGAEPAQYLRYYADLIVQSGGEEERGTTLVRREPIGVAAAIPPFNAPQVLLLEDRASACCRLHTCCKAAARDGAGFFLAGRGSH